MKGEKLIKIKVLFFINVLFSKIEIVTQFEKKRIDHKYPFFFKSYSKRLSKVYTERNLFERMFES